MDVLNSGMPPRTPPENAALLPALGGECRRMPSVQADAVIDIPLGGAGHVPSSLAATQGGEMQDI